MFSFDLKTSMLSFILNNSLIDAKQKLHISSTGRMDYFGDSPMGLLLTMYALHHPSPKTFLPLLQSSTNDIQPSTKLFDNVVASLNCLDIESNIMTLSVKAYFKYFHPYCAIVDKYSFLKNVSHQSPVLIYMVCAIGCGYLPDMAEAYREVFCDRAIHHIKECYSKPSLQTIAALLLMANYQHTPREFSKGWVYLGMAQRMCYQLGFDRNISRRSSPAERELRSRIWFWSHILDKLYSFSLNRPWTQDCGITSPKPPSNYKLDLIYEDASEIVTSKSSLMFLTSLSELCYLMCVMVRKFKFTEVIKTNDIVNSEKMAKMVAKYLDLWKSKAEKGFEIISQEGGGSHKYLIENFKSGLMIIYYGTLVQLYQSFSEVGIPSLNEYYNIKCSDAANKAIKVANGMGKNFNFHCITYKFYALSSAIMIQIKNTRSINPKRTYESHQNLIIGLRIISSAQPYYTLAPECLRLASLLANAEGIDLNDLSIISRQDKFAGDIIPLIRLEELLPQMIR
ncbi:hypothetical protein K502DRAFT_328007 [Neoconidiobolus thromboides FSU 785]|nr:hypothetical protein K502DRAFT_328007 [Neoconidiobolus thromboides FSU 785]